MKIIIIIFLLPAICNAVFFGFYGHLYCGKELQTNAKVGVYHTKDGSKTLLGEVDTNEVGQFTYKDPNATERPSSESILLEIKHNCNTNGELATKEVTVKPDVQFGDNINYIGTYQLQN